MRDDNGKGTAMLHHRGLDRTEQPAMPCGMTGNISEVIRHGHMTCQRL